MYFWENPSPTFMLMRSVPTTLYNAVVHSIGNLPGLACVLIRGPPHMYPPSWMIHITSGVPQAHVCVDGTMLECVTSQCLCVAPLWWHANCSTGVSVCAASSVRRGCTHPLCVLSYQYMLSRTRYSDLQFYGSRLFQDVSLRF